MCIRDRHEDALLVVNTYDVGSYVRRLRMTDGVELARSPRLFYPAEMAMAGNLLFVPTEHNISVLDIHTLELRNTFGEWAHLYDCAIQNGELYVADGCEHSKLFVYSLDGQHRRDILGDFCRPMSFCIRDDRIYLIECLDYIDDEEDEDDEDDEEHDEFAGRRLLVLELDGTIHQQIILPNCVAPRTPELTGMLFRGDELLITDGQQHALHVLRFV